MSIAAENDGVSLLEDAIWTLDVVSVDRVADLLRDKVRQWIADSVHQRPPSLPHDVEHHPVHAMD